MGEFDPEIERIKALKAQRMLLGIDDKKQKIKVQVYSTKTCPYCHMAKEYLRSKNIEFEDIDVSENEAAGEYMVMQTGQMGVPQINIGGQWVLGFDREKIDALLSL
jgi:glutaredoxin-like YruB-family protein